MQDFQSKTDIERWVRAFYSDLLLNEEMQFVFAGLDFEKHIPRIVQFWALILLDEQGYTSNVFDKHLHLPLKDHHFDIWLTSFEKITHAMFTGPKADLAIQRAQVIAYTFRTKLQQMGRFNP